MKRNNLNNLLLKKPKYLILNIFIKSEANIGRPLLLYDEKTFTLKEEYSLLYFNKFKMGGKNSKGRICRINNFGFKIIMILK